MTSSDAISIIEMGAVLDGPILSQPDELSRINALAFAKTGRAGCWQRRESPVRLEHLSPVQPHQDQKALQLTLFVNYRRAPETAARASPN
jgi:hypothetical protein